MDWRLSGNEGVGSIYIKGMGISFRDDENVLEVNRGADCQIL